MDYLPLSMHRMSFLMAWDARTETGNEKTLMSIVSNCKERYYYLAI